ncbi:MAG: C25 family cysteine peptidase [Acidobacteriota bacterium]
MPSGSTLIMGPTATITGTGNSAFTLASGASIQIGSTAGITSSGATGNIQVPNTRTYSTGANYTYNGVAAQVTGVFTTTPTSATVNDLTIDNSAGVTLSGNLTCAGLLSLTTGDLLTTASFTLSQSGTGNGGLGSSATGTGDVIGTVSRIDFGTTTRSFGNVNVQVNGGTGGGISTMTVNLVKQAPPTFPSAVTRVYTLTPGTGTIGTGATLRLRYKDSELNGNTDETMLQLWRLEAGTPATWQPKGGTPDTTNNHVTATVTGFSSWVIAGQNAPTDVAMVKMKATRVDNRVLLEWQTGYEVRNLGFNIYREQKGTYTRINPEPVAGTALLFGPRVALRAGFAYAWWDRGIADCGLRIAECEGIRYWIEDMDLNGHASMHGPFGVERSSGEEAPEVGKEQAPLLGAIGADAAKLGASAPVERVAKLLKPTAAGLAVQAGIASQQAVKLSVKHEGWYRVEQADLLAAGFPASADSLKLQLFVDGQEVPILVTSTSTSPGKGSKPIPAPWDGIEFYGIGIDSAFTDSHVYWLVAGSQNGLRIKTVPSKGGTPAPATFTFAVERRDKVVYFPSLQNGGAEKFFGPVIYNAQAVDQSVTLQHVASTGSATLDVSLQGYTDAPHSVRVLLNGSELGTVQFAGLAKGTAQYSIPQTSLLEGSNQVQFISPAGFSDITMVESVRMSYQHTNTADGNSLRFPATGSQQPTIAGFTSAAVRVLDVTNPGSPQEVETTVEQDGAEYSATVTVPGAGARTLLAFASDQKKTPAALVANQPSSWRTAKNGADYIAVTRKDLISSLQPLANQRKSQGLKTSVVDIEDVYDEFSFGHKTPQALKDFFVYTKTSWKIGPRFAVLAGDATYDPKNYTGVGDFDVVPTRLFESAFSETATDDWFVDFNEDAVPDIAIGRLPVRTPQETATLAEKIISYDSSESVNRVLLVVDHNDGYDFEAADNQLQSLIPATLTVIGIRRGQVGDSAARTQLLNELNLGAKFVNFYGHGSTLVWTNASILTAADAASLGNTDRLALFDAMTCFNGFFHDVSIASLGEALLKAPGGAIAVWASSGMTDAGGQVQMNEEAMRQLFGGGGLTIGEVTARAKAATGNPDVRATWILLGDPATKLK